MIRSFQITIIAVTLLSCFTINAQEDNQSLLWEISSNGMKKPSYLFGTIHLTCADKYVWTSTMKQKFEESDELCMEMDLDDPAIMVEIAAGMILTNGKVLKDYFSESDYTLLKNYFRDSIGMSVETFSMMKPIALQTMMTTSGARCDSTISYELTLTSAAKEMKKEITGLETAAEQIAILDRFEGDSTAKEIIEFIKGESEESDDYEKLMDVYYQQNIASLYDYIQNDSLNIDDMYRFLDERNEKWISRMVDKMEQRSVFFAVGAGHLWGDKGVISLLREEGYTVKPIH